MKSIAVGLFDTDSSGSTIKSVFAKKRVGSTIQYSPYLPADYKQERLTIKIEDEGKVSLSIANVQVDKDDGNIFGCLLESDLSLYPAQTKLEVICKYWYF